MVYLIRFDDPKKISLDNITLKIDVSNKILFPNCTSTSIISIYDSHHNVKDKIKFAKKYRDFLKNLNILELKQALQKINESEKPSPDLEYDNLFSEFNNAIHMTQATLNLVNNTREWIKKYKGLLDFNFYNHIADIEIVIFNNTFNTSINNECTLETYHSTSYGRGCQFIGFFGLNANSYLVNNFTSDRVAYILNTKFFNTDVPFVIDDINSSELYRKIYKNNYNLFLAKLNWQEHIITTYTSGTGKRPDDVDIDTHITRYEGENTLIDEYIMIANTILPMFVVRINRLNPINKIIPSDNYYAFIQNILFIENTNLQFKILNADELIKTEFGKIFISYFGEIPYQTSQQELLEFITNIQSLKIPAEIKHHQTKLADISTKSSFHNKYLKYKEKYLKLKNSMNILSFT
jgi:hypothetical protein